MAKLLKVSEVANLTPDRNSMTRRVTDILTPQVEYQPDMLNQLRFEYGGNDQIAIELSGTSDKKSKEYKAAIRSVQKWFKGESKPGGKYQEKIKQAAMKGDAGLDYLRDAAGEQGGSLNVSFTATVTISKITEERTLHATMDAADFYLAALDSNMNGFQAVAQAGGYPPLVAVYGLVSITIS